LRRVGRTLSSTVTAVIDPAASTRRGPAPLWVLLGVLVAAEAALEVITPGGRGIQLLAHDWLHDLIGGLAALACVARVVAVREDRWAWGAIAAALAGFAIGQVLWTLLYRHQPAEPGANITDPFFLALYPLAILGLSLLIRAHVPRFEFHRWLDGIVVVLIVATPGVALVLVPVAERSTGDALADVVNFAYPLLDILLVGAVLGVFAITGWRPGMAWVWLGLGFLLLAVPDSIAAVERLHGPELTAHRPDHLEGYDFLWTLGLLSVAYASWKDPPGPIPIERPTGLRAVALPLAAQALAVATLIFSFFHDIPAGGRPLTLAVLLLGMVQIYVSRPRPPS
jgi:hypothetical protein